MARPTAAERRLDYLRIGADLVTGFGYTNSPGGPLEALANVKVSDVARHARVTKGALYHLWDSQESYWHDLLKFLLDEGRLAGSAVPGWVEVMMNASRPLTSFW